MTEAAESTPAVADLLARARVYVEGSHAKQTLEAYAADWKHFSTWCEKHKRRSLPAAPETMALRADAQRHRLRRRLSAERVGRTDDGRYSDHPRGLMRLRIGAQRHRHLAALEDR
jgi:hypothetical protein